MWRLFLTVSTACACSLCPLRVPPRPRPLDQYKLPSIPHLNLETMPQFCEDFTQSTCLLLGWDSLGKPAAGVSDGNYYWLGDYELCTKLRRDGKFDGRYCRVELEIPDALVEEGCPQTDPLAIVLGVCMPSSCTDDQLHQLIQDYSPYKSVIDCELDVHLSTSALIMLGAICFWLTLQILVTVLDLQSSFWMSLNIKINASRALSTKRAPQNLHALHGLEFITFIWLVTAMVYNFMQPYIENVAFSYDAVSSVAAHPTNNYSYLVDGLLALSALYTTYLLYGDVATIFDILDVIRVTLLRFWPAYAFCVLFMWILFPEMSAGPLWIHTDTVERCTDSWWKNLLFINNFYGVKNTCVDFGYVVSLEALYFVPLVILIYVARKRLLLAKIIAIVIMSLTISWSFYRTFVGALPPAPLLTAEPVPVELTERMLDEVLVSPFTRASPTIVGFLFGVCMWNEDGTLYKDIFGKASSRRALPQLNCDSLLQKFHAIPFQLFTVMMTMWAALSGLFVMFSLMPFATSSVGHPLFLAFYAAFHRPLWATSLLSFLYLSHHGSFAWIHAILTWRIFSPLSKLTWIALVFTEPIILYFFSSLYRPSYATNWSTIYAAVSASTLAYLAALLIDIFLTRPIRCLLHREQLYRYRSAQTS
ncbi:unnamed protein product [Haemonchus placei]|uniref:NRF domain-containing protein n=1 Tax=Haemonchus placei TaxID=6290 RepID=A0A0N4WWA4_HAEPC|nr:unnamed protein product [Haemonchus placei]